MHFESDEMAISLMRAALSRELGIARRQSGMTQEYVAQAIGIATEVYGRMERGYCGVSIETLFKLSRLLGVTTDTLLGQGLTHPAPGMMSVPNAQHRVLIKTIRQLNERDTKVVHNVAKALVRHK
jgi:transcriptional regulator with XRE-family HTH domain